MKARIENGRIKTYGELPDDFQNILNFRQADPGIHRAHGFFDVVVPTYDPLLQQLGPIFFDDRLQVFTYEVTDLTLDLEAEKENKLLEFEQEFDRKRHELMLATYELVIDALRDQLPQDVVALYDQLRAMKQQYTAEIENRSREGIRELIRYRVQPQDSQAVSYAIAALKR